MLNEPSPPFPGSTPKYELLRRLVERYELGELSDEEFRLLKQQILLGHTPSQSTTVSQIGLLLAVYPDVTTLNTALGVIRGLSLTQRARIVDAATVSKSPTGAVHIRAISEITKPLGAHSVSVVGAVSGLMFSPESLYAEQFSSSLVASFNAFTWDQLRADDIRAAGQSLLPDMLAILLLCWPSAVNKLTKALRGYQSVTHLALRGDLAEGIIAILADAHDELSVGGR